MKKTKIRSQKKTFKLVKAGSMIMIFMVCNTSNMIKNESKAKINSSAHTGNYETDARADSIRRDWFYRAHFGMFVHWGVYAVPARGEWVMNRELIPLEEYKEKYAGRFTAENFDPAEWARIAKNAGMKYIVLTARHHDGFCLWDTKTKEFNAMTYGPEKDLIRLYVDAVRKAGLKVGLYYSVADWTHPDYPPFERDWPTTWASEEARKRFIEYYQSQVRELMTNYGKIDILWWDGTAPEEGLEGAAINREVYELQPGILINSRNEEPYDFNTSEQRIAAGDMGKPWEACMTLNGSWGYHATDHFYKTPKEVITILLKATSGGGNLLLNVGPKADGTIPEESVKILDEVGTWIKKNHEFLEGRAERTDFAELWNKNIIPTVQGSKIYLHFYNAPTESEHCYAEIKNEVLSVKFLETGKEIEFVKNGPRLFLLDLPKFDEFTVTTVVVEVKGKPKVHQVRTD